MNEDLPRHTTLSHWLITWANLPLTLFSTTAVSVDLGWVILVLLQWWDNQLLTLIQQLIAKRESHSNTGGCDEPGANYTVIGLVIRGFPNWIL